MEPIGAGRASRVFALDEHRALRRGGSDAASEARVMRFAREAGVPVPEVFEVSGGDMVMERLHGPTLAAAMLAGRVTVPEGADVLLGLHEGLDRVEAPEWLTRSPRGIAMDGGAVRLLHLDLHAENVVLTDRGPSLIDWANAAAGRRECDLAVSWAIMAGADLDSLGVEPALAEAITSDVTARLGRGLSDASLRIALRFRAADANVGAAETARVRKALEHR